MINPMTHNTKSGLSFLTALFLIGSSLWAHPPGGGNQPATTFSGRAVVVDAEVLGLHTVISDTGNLPSSGGALQTSLLTASVPGLLTANVLHATSIGQGTEASSEASVADLRLTAAGVAVSADFIMSRAQADCATSPSLSGSSELVNLNVQGVPIVVSGSPNQTVTLLNVTVIINEQTAASSGNTGSITVNALHVFVTDPLNPSSVLADVVVSSAHADITCNQTVCGGGDFVTGGGWITGTPSGARG